MLRAFDPQLQRPVAIKVLNAVREELADDGHTIDLRTEGSADDLLAEARALARITDPNVLAIHEIGRERGHTFLVTELVDGEDLRGWLAAEPRSLDAIYRVFLQAASGLSAAHRRGLIHRRPSRTPSSPTSTRTFERGSRSVRKHARAASTAW